MVRIIASKKCQNNDGKSFIALQIQGDPEFIQSQQTGRMYLTAKTCWITTTFDELTANALIGKELPGTVERVPSQPYEYKIESSGELVTLSHRFVYRPILSDEVNVQMSSASNDDLQTLQELA